jgi:hypothetical protein
MVNVTEFDGVPLTRREVIIARQAYIARARETVTPWEWEEIEPIMADEAAEHYPLPPEDSQAD